MINLKTLFSGKTTEPEAIPPAPPASPEPETAKPRTSIEVQAELDFARASIEPLTEKFTAARRNVETAQQRFDTEAKAFALGQRTTEPDRGELQAALSFCDALRRVSGDQERIITRLTAELASVRLAEATDSDNGRLSPLIDSAEAAYDEFARSIIEFRRAEQVLYSALFDSRTGLRQRFTTSDAQVTARKAMCNASFRAQELARKHGLFDAIHKNFETNGEENMGRDQAEYIRLASWHAHGS